MLSRNLGGIKPKLRGLKVVVNQKGDRWEWLGGSGREMMFSNRPGIFVIKGEVGRTDSPSLRE